MAKSGRKPKGVEVAGEKIEGLYYDKGLNVYYFYKVDEKTGKKTKLTRRKKTVAALELYNYNLQYYEQKKVKVFVGREEAKSVHGQKTIQYLEWSKTEEYQNILDKYPDWKKGGIQRKLCDSESRKAFAEYEKSIIYTTNIPENIVIEKFVEMLDANPRKLSETFIQMGREDLASIIHLPKNYKASRTKLTDLLQWYLTDEERSRDTIKYAKLFWGQFCKNVNTPHLEQITLPHISAYKEKIEKLQERHKYSRKWLKSRYEMVKRITKHSKLHIEDKSEVNRVIDNMAMLRSKDNGSGNKDRVLPKPISREEFLTFLDQITEQYKNAKNITKQLRYSKWRAILLTGANTCSYLQDLVDMHFVARKGELGLDLEAGTLAMYREKSSIAKVAVLWQETIDSIKIFRELLNVSNSHVFSTRKNKHNTAAHLRREFSRYIRPEVLAKNLLMRSDIKFNEIRDACFTACAEAELPIEQRNYISGHRNAGDDDAYLLRQPKLAQPASDACYKYFFGQKIKIS